MRLVLISLLIFLFTFVSCDNGSVKNNHPDDLGNSVVDEEDTGNSGEDEVDEEDEEEMDGEDGEDQEEMDGEDEVDDKDVGDTGDTGDSGNTGDTGDTGDTGNTGNTGVDPTEIFQLGPHFVLTNEYDEGDNDAPRDFKVYEPQGATGNVPVIHFQHGFQLKYNYYDDVLVHLASHGFIVVSSQSAHSMIGGDATPVEAEKVATFITWMKTDLPNRIAVTADLTKFGVSGHSRGGKVTNHMLNGNPSLAVSFFGLDPVDSSPPTGGDPHSLESPVLFTGRSMFLGAEKGPNGFQACAPAGENSVAFYAGYPSPSWHIVAAGVGHMDMIDEPDLSACGMTCSLCDGSDDNALNTSFRTYSGAMMAAFFSYTLKDISEYQPLLSNTANHPFMNTLAESK